MLPKKAIVSPCSTCKNQRSAGQDGKPACPRRQWLDYAKKLTDAEEDVSPTLQPLLLTGTEGTDNEGSNTLANPVYDDSNHHILVWVAKLEDNKGVYDQDGNLISPHILSPDFDTDYIQCTSEPYVVQETEASYFQKGAYKENDQLEVIDSTRDQLSLTTGDVADFDSIKVAGSAKKVNFAFGFNRQPVPRDLSPRGT